MMINIPDNYNAGLWHGDIFDLETGEEFSLAPIPHNNHEVALIASSEHIDGIARALRDDRHERFVARQQIDIVQGGDGLFYVLLHGASDSEEIHQYGIGRKTLTQAREQAQTLYDACLSALWSVECGKRTYALVSPLIDIARELDEGDAEHVFERLLRVEGVFEVD